jgi:hypothetical protein
VLLSDNAERHKKPMAAARENENGGVLANAGKLA